MGNEKVCKVVMLPTEDTVNIFHDGKKMFHSIGLEPQTGHSINSDCNGIHIHLLSEDAICEGDWYLQPEGLRRSAAKTGTCAFPPNSLKIVASTDPSLGLPMIPESFLKEYVDVNGAIIEVWLETYPQDSVSMGTGIVETEYKLCLADNNEVVVLRVINMNQNLADFFGTPLGEAFGADSKDITIEDEQVIINKDTDSVAPIKIPISSHRAFTPEDIRNDSDRLYPEPTKQRGIHGQLVPSSSYWEERQAYVRGRMDERELKDCTNGIKALVGTDGSKPLFVKGSYDAIKLLQEQLIELDTLRTKYLRK